MLTIEKNKEIKSVWGLGSGLEDLRPYYNSTLQNFVEAPAHYIFGSKTELLEALKNNHKTVKYKIESEKKTTEEETTISFVLDRIQYQKIQAGAKSDAERVFDAAKKNDAKVFAGQRCDYYYQGAYMSGDQFAVGAALRQDGTSRLILLYGKDEENNAKNLVKFYVSSCKLSAERLLPVLVTDSKVAYQVCNEVLDKRLKKEALPLLQGNLAFLASIPTKGARLFPVGGATTNVAASVLSSDQGTLAKDWGVDPSSNRYWAFRIDQFLNGKQVQKKGSYVILWTRFSGKGGGAHPELDDSWTGLGQVVHELLAKDRDVIVVGKPRNNRDIKAKFEEHLDELDKSKKKKVARDKLKIWGEYWKTDGGQPNEEIIGANRAAEYAIFLRMVHPDWGCKIVHLGMRSGAMDAAALLGMRTLFIEDKDNRQIERTTKWTGTGNDNPRYKRIPVSELPTWTAKTGNRKEQSKDPPRRGYNEKDLQMIVQAVESALQ